MSAGDQRGASVRQRARHRFGHRALLGWRRRCRHQQRGLVDRGETRRRRHHLVDIPELREERRPVKREDPPNLIRERVPGILAQDLADQCLVDRIDAVVRSHLAEAITDCLRPRQRSGRQAERVTLRQGRAPAPGRNSAARGRSPPLRRKLLDSDSSSSRLVSPIVWAQVRARPSIEAVMSIPMASPDAPVICAAISRSVPAPQPRSSTISPG